jgi:hypothetical protein
VAKRNREATASGRLRALGDSLGQGFHLAEPTHPDEVTRTPAGQQDDGDAGSRTMATPTSRMMATPAAG